MKFIMLSLAIFGLTFIASCKDNKSSSVDTSTQNEWTQEQREEFMQGCIEGSVATYKNRGQEPNREQINQICICTGKALEAKYSMKDMGDMPNEQRDELLKEITQNCAKELSQSTQ